MKTPSFFLALLLLVSMGSNTYAETRGVYLHNDLFGTAVAATNEAGEVIWRKDYTPYGETKSKDGANSVGFTGHQEDDLSLNTNAAALLRSADRAVFVDGQQANGPQ